jgi:hypothetical protein
MEPYKPHLFYKLYRALQDEGLKDEEMVFADNMTFVSELGFFTLRFDQEIPQVVHFLVWKENRSYYNGIRLYRELKRILIQLGIVQFIALADKPFWLKLFKVWGKDVKFHSKKGNNKFYTVRIGRTLQ